MFKYINFTIDVKSYADLLKAYQAERALLAMKGDVIRTVSEGKIRFTTKERDSFLYLMKVEGYAIGINSVSFEERNGTQVCLTRTVWYTYR